MHNQKKGNEKFKNKKHPNKFKNKNNQNCQKIKLPGSQTTKGLKKKHSSRSVGGAEMVSWDGEDSWQGGGWSPTVDKVAAGRLGGPTFCMWINQEEQLGSKTDHTTQGSSMGNENLKTSN